MLEEREEIEEKLEEKDLNKEVVLNHAIATPQQGTFDMLQDVKHPDEIKRRSTIGIFDLFTCYSLQKKPKEERLNKEEIMEDYNAPEVIVNVNIMTRYKLCDHNEVETIIGKISKP
ncbi:unnamed protein product [Citrullus colocynthis]|uniref:Uncharacterized protein n=1 Tax=Citrullus colocynthis TaxID=252529 RepID=A0ABP0YZ82_9ROSI